MKLTPVYSLPHEMTNYRKIWRISSKNLILSWRKTTVTILSLGSKHIWFEGETIFGSWSLGSTPTGRTIGDVDSFVQTTAVEPDNGAVALLVSGPCSSFHYDEDIAS
jgi:hypothetical protein